MSSLEIINFRSAGSMIDSIEKKLLESINIIIARDKAVNIKMYHHAILPTDLSLHIRHKSKSTTIPASTIGLQLVSVLREYGLVNHTLWIEINPNKEASNNKRENHENI